MIKLILAHSKITSGQYLMVENYLCSMVYLVERYFVRMQNQFCVHPYERISRIMLIRKFPVGHDHVISN